MKNKGKRSNSPVRVSIFVQSEAIKEYPFAVFAAFAAIPSVHRANEKIANSLCPRRDPRRVVE